MCNEYTLCKNQQEILYINAEEINLKYISKYDIDCFSDLNKLILNKNYELKLSHNTTMLNRHVNIFECSCCGITEVYEKDFSGLPSLETLDLSNNSIKQIDSKAFLHNPHVIFLNLSFNLLEEFGIAIDIFASNKSLKTLDLSYNSQLSFSSDKYFIYSTSLERLFINNCNLKMVYNKTFQQLPVLKELFLQNNLIHKIYSQSFQGLKDLTFLQLDNNSLNSLSLKHVTDNLMYICIDNNAFKYNREYTKLHDELKKRKLLQRNSNTKCENTNGTMSFEYIMESRKNAGISGAFISTYLVMILLAEGIVLAILILYYVKLKGRVQDGLKYANTILNDHDIYKICKTD